MAMSEKLDSAHLAGTTPSSSSSSSLAEKPMMGSSSSGDAEWNFELTFEFIVHGILLGSVGVLGLIGNTVSIIVLSRPQMKSSINTILIGLVCCDILLIVTSIFMFCFNVLHCTGIELFRFYRRIVYPYALSFVYPIGMIAQTGSAYLTLAITIERYLAVCWSLKARHLCTRGRARGAVAAFLGFAILYNIPRFLEITWGVELEPNTNRNQTVYLITELRKAPLYVSIYVTWMYLVFMYIVPFASLAIFNLLIFLEIRRAGARRAKLTMQEKKEHNLATMFLVVVLVFFICNILPLIVNILEVVHISNQQLIQVSNFLVTINSSVNILVYCTFGNKFKTVFMQIFFGRQPQIQTTTAFRNQSFANHNATMRTSRSNKCLSVQRSQGDARRPLDDDGGASSTNIVSPIGGLPELVTVARVHQEETLREGVVAVIGFHKGLAANPVEDPDASEKPVLASIGKDRPRRHCRHHCKKHPHHRCHHRHHHRGKSLPTAGGSSEVASQTDFGSMSVEAIVRERAALLDDNNGV